MVLFILIFVLLDSNHAYRRLWDQCVSARRVCLYSTTEQLCAVLPTGNWTEGTVNTTLQDSCVQCCQLATGLREQ